MTVHVYIVQETPVRLWGLTSHERARRVLAARHPVHMVTNLERLPEQTTVLVLRGDYLLDDRVLCALTRTPGRVLRVPAESGMVAVAAHVPVALARPVADYLQKRTQAGEPPGNLAWVKLADLVPPEREQLLKADPPFAVRVTSAAVAALEWRLFGSAYKGVTDFVTKWVWPTPAYWGVRLCVKLGLQPNHVTALSWVLATVAGLLFWQGHFGAGLVLGWLMTYLDTVDGKLARVTVSASPFGHLFDHILDLLHPPFWYLAWGLGLTAYQPMLLPDSLALAFWLIFVGYLAGRLVEGAFQLWLGRFGIFIWRKIDSFNRLVTARRNPCLVLLTCALLGGRPDLGLEAVALWTALSSVFLLVRLLMAWAAKHRAGALQSWLVQSARDPSDRSRAVRWFVGNVDHAAGKGGTTQ